MYKLLLSVFLFVLLVQADSSSVSPTYLEKQNSKNLIFSGQYRGRYDIYNGLNKAAYGDDEIDSKGKVRGSSDDAIFLQQIIAGVTYIPNSDLEFKFFMYDARSWNSSLSSDDFIKNSATTDEYKMSFYDDHLELFESYVKFKNLFNENLTLTLGRQQLGYGDSRIFGPGKWGNTIGWLWDAVHISYKKDENFIDIWYGQTRIKEVNDFSLLNKHRYQGIGIYSHFENMGLKIEPFFAWKNSLYHDVTARENLYYGGARIYDKGPGLIYDGTFVKESGKTANMTNDAYAYIAKAGYQFSDEFHSRLLFGLIYASGDKDATDNKKETFVTPFGSNDGSHYGRMDLMFLSNMKDLQANFLFKPLKSLSVEMAYHHFKLAEVNDKWYQFGYRNNSGNSYDDIGDEYDFSVKYRLNAYIDILGIYGYFNAGDFIIKNYIAQNNSSKMFLQVTYKF